MSPARAARLRARVRTPLQLLVIAAGVLVVAWVEVPS